MAHSPAHFFTTLALVTVVSQTMAMRSHARELPPPTGEHAIGRATYYWTDANRPETYSDDPTDHRQVRVDVWYPAQPGAKRQRRPDCADLPAFGKKIGAEALFFGSLKSHAVQDAALVAGDERFAVLVFSPGYGTNACQYTGLIEELASHGYVVAAVDYPYQSKAIAFPDGRIVTGLPTSGIDVSDRKQHDIDYAKRLAILSADLQFVLDRLAELDSQDGARFSGRLDLSRIGALGHSIGGIASAEVGRDDPRFRAIANLDGHHWSLPLRARDDGQLPSQPLIELTDGPSTPTDKQLEQWKMTRAEFESQMTDATKRANGVMQAIAGGGYRVTIEGVRHNSFGDLVMWDLVPLEVRRQRLQSIRDYLRAFLRRDAARTE